MTRRRLRSLRLARGWSLDELAKRAHIGPSTISRIETDHRRIALDQLVALGRAHPMPVLLSGSSFAKRVGTTTAPTKLQIAFVWS